MLYRVSALQGIYPLIVAISPHVAALSDDDGIYVATPAKSYNFLSVFLRKTGKPIATSREAGCFCCRNRSIGMEQER